MVELKEISENHLRHGIYICTKPGANLFLCFSGFGDTTENPEKSVQEQFLRSSLIPGFVKYRRVWFAGRTGNQTRE